MLAVPVDRRAVGVHHVRHVDHHGVALADLSLLREKEILLFYRYDFLSVFKSSTQSLIIYRIILECPRTLFGSVVRVEFGWTYTRKITRSAKRFCKIRQ